MKPHVYTKHYEENEVAPHAGAWIETIPYAV